MFLSEVAAEVPSLGEYGNNMAMFPRLEKQLNSAIDEKGEIKSPIVGYHTPEQLLPLLK